MSTAKVEEEEQEEKKGTLRSVVYTIAVLVEITWMIFLVWEVVWILTRNLNVYTGKANWEILVVVRLD